VPKSQQKLVQSTVSLFILPEVTAPQKKSTFCYHPNSPYIVAGDFNAYHSSWESNSTENLAGKSIFAAITDHPDATIITPKDLGTRINPSS
jgi:hypothetical protein